MDGKDFSRPATRQDYDEKRERGKSNKAAGASRFLNGKLLSATSSSSSSSPSSSEPSDYDLLLLLLLNLLLFLAMKRKGSFSLSLRLMLPRKILPPSWKFQSAVDYLSTGSLSRAVSSGYHEAEQFPLHKGKG